ncbi:methyltransferase domain-containing protein [Tardiphaga sp. vice154]|uniref:class I SAM-dependent methyltransferase n=1 Tax=Tardiphaga sp. vice154 TaxID=2592814 RepID=UPI00116533F0|nr:methyltransferase domain-containing protein [Tardiphaga sp. vice154]QDM22644.1 methyltransferase domain-containing protein [Tardiphaga sp. vice154]
MTSTDIFDRFPRLHLGAFNCAVDHWINTDVTRHIWVSRIPLAARALHMCRLMGAERYREHREGRFRKLRYMDLTKPLPFPDRSISAVFSAHVFEHLFPDEVEALTREIARVIVPGGVCRVVVPDLERIVASYDVAQPYTFIRQMFEVESRSSAAFAHHWAFTRPSLNSLFQAAGFTETAVTNYRVGRCPDLAQLDNRPDESIFFEAIK